MKLLQQPTEFQPIAIVLETPEEARTFWDLLNREHCTEVYDMAIAISDWLSNKGVL